MKSSFLQLTLISLMIIFYIPNLSSAQTYPNEPDGFRNYRWGDLQEGIKDEMEYVETMRIREFEVVWYRIKGDLLSIGDAVLSSIRYGFWRGKLMQVAIVCHGQSNFLSLRKATFEQFGATQDKDASNPYLKNYYLTYEWGEGDIFKNLPKAKTTSIRLSYAIKLDLGQLHLSSVKLYEDLEKESNQQKMKLQGW